jgi:hypothetical protein
MVQNLVAAFSLLIGLAGLTLTYASHRQKFQRDREQERRASALSQLMVTTRAQGGGVSGA